MPMLQMLGSISTGTDEDEGNYKNVVVVEDDEDFCTYLNGGSCNKRGDQTCVLTPSPLSWQDCSSDWTKQFEASVYHCSATETLLM